MYVDAGQTIYWSWVRGKWTADARKPHKLPNVGPEGYVDRSLSKAQKGCRLKPENRTDAPYGQLIGRVGENGKQVNLDRGGGFTNYGSKGGFLYLRINEVDRCLADNAGTITMRFADYAMLDKNCKTVQATDHADCKVALRPHVSSPLEEKFEKLIVKEMTSKIFAGCAFFDVAEQVTPSDSPAKGGVVFVSCAATSYVLKK